MTVKVNRKLAQKEKSLLPNRIKPKVHHIEMKEIEDKTIINIYNEKNL